MSKVVKSTEADQKYIHHHVMDSDPLAGQKSSSSWKDYISVTKEGIVFSNMLTVFIGMWLAAGGGIALFSSEPLSVILLTMLGSSFIVASGTCLNNYYDRDIDQIMSRTKNRALVEGRLQPQQVMWMGFILGFLGTVLLLFVNVLATMVALVGLFVYVVLYTMWLKRTHHLNTIIGSISGAIPPMIGWAAITGSLDAGAWVLFLIMFLWQPPHFLAIAIRRCEDYRAAGIPMLPVVRGFEETKRQMVLYVATLLPASLYIILVSNLGFGYAIFALLLGLSWLGYTFYGLFIKKDENEHWAKNNFLCSIAYMTFLFIGMMLFTI